HLAFLEPDQPQSRKFTLAAPDGTKLFDGRAEGGFSQSMIQFDPSGKYDDALLVLDVSDGANDYMIHMTLNSSFTHLDPYDDNFTKEQRGPGAVLAADEQTARDVCGGAIYYDGQVFWHMFQVRFHDWIK